jgi:hypothetical protein
MAKDLADELFDLADRAAAANQKLARLTGDKGLTGRKREAVRLVIASLDDTLRDLRAAVYDPGR